MADCARPGSISSAVVLPKMDGHSPGKSQMGVFSSTLVWHCLAVAFGGLLFGIEISIISGAKDAFQVSCQMRFDLQAYN